MKYNLSNYINIISFKMVHKRADPHNLSKTIALLLIITAIRCGSEVSRTPVSGYWQLHIDYCPRIQMSGLIVNTTIPTVLHLDLLKYGKIVDPFFGDNYKKLQWVSSCNVTYSKNLTFSPNATSVQIVFEGIDTYSTIKFNGKTMMQTNNSFVEYRLKLSKDDIKNDGQNLLQVQLYSTRKFDEEANRKIMMPFQYAHTRKAAYQYSWDWAPYLNTMGIWKNVYILSYENVYIDYVWVRNRAIFENSAILNFAIALASSNPSQISNKYTVEISNGKQKLAHLPVMQSQVYTDIQIPNPKLWWPNGIGQPNMYDFKIKLIRNSNLSTIDQKSVPFGIRSVQLNQIDNQFTVVVNGHPVYCKGSNYVPMDMFYPRLTNEEYIQKYNYKNLINDAVQSHFNMIRIWGGGQYESSQFLQYASRKGIMIFYDFMFSDSIYPSHTEFLKIIQTQVTQQIRRARNYPCLVLWSGNNQILQGIHSWGWNRGTYPNDYKKIFQQTIPEIIKKQSPYIPYIPSSPVNGVGNSGFQKGGDIHYWGVWAAGALFEAFETAIGPFNSQFGTQGIPVWQTVSNFTSSDQRSYTSPQFQAHERHNSKFNTLTKYIKHYAHQSKNFEHEVYLSGLVQAYAIEIAIKYQRIAKPKSFGTLYWQLNDAWPAISWSSIDYYGRWKPLQYMAKRLFPDVAVFCAKGKVIAVNDNLYPVNALVIIKVQNMNGRLAYNKTVDISLEANEVKEIEQISKDKYVGQLNQIVIFTQIVAGRQKSMSSTFFFVNFKQIQLGKTAKLYVKLLEQHRMLIVRTDKFIKNLYISSSREYLKLSDNYFDMIADKIYKISIDDKVNINELRSDLVFRSYLQIHSDQKLEVIYE